MICVQYSNEIFINFVSTPEISGVEFIHPANSLCHSRHLLEPIYKTFPFTNILNISHLIFWRLCYRGIFLFRFSHGRVEERARVPIAVVQIWLYEILI